MSTPSNRPVSRLRSKRWRDFFAFVVMLAAGVLPLVDLGWWTWASGVPFPALVVVAVALVMLRWSSPQGSDELEVLRRTCLCAIALAALVVLAGQAYDVWLSSAHPYEDDYLSTETGIGGYFFMAVFSTVGLGATVFGAIRAARGGFGTTRR